MKKAATVLYIVSFVLCIVSAVSLLLPSPVFIVLGVSPKINQMVAEWLDEFAGDSLSLEQSKTLTTLFQASFLMTGVLFVLIGLACVVNAIVINRARKEETRELYIATIVLGAFTVNLTILAGIFSLVSLKQQGTQEADN